MDTMLEQAVKVCNDLYDHFFEVYKTTNLEVPMPSVEWTPTTLAVLIDGTCHWEDQCDTEDELTFAHLLTGER